MRSEDSLGFHPPIQACSSALSGCARCHVSLTACTWKMMAALGLMRATPTYELMMDVEGEDDVPYWTTHASSPGSSVQ